MADAVISVATEEAVRPLLDSISTQLGYIWNYKTNFDNLKKQVQNLQDRKVVLEHSIIEARSQGEEIEQHVVNWLNRVNMMIDEATVIIEDDNKADKKCFKNLCPDLKKRYQHSKKAAVMAKDVSELHNEGKFDKISYRNLPEETWHPSNKPFEDFESRMSTLTYVINALSNPDVHMIGVHGMGGIGKTTLAREVGRKTEESKIFDVIVFVEVSDSPNIRTIQGVIADKLGLEFRQETEPGRANALCERLKKEMKILLILDNIWESLDLEKVGIPFNDDHKGCKLLLTARKANVLSDEMGCDYENNFPIGILNEKEAWNLFKKIAGSCVEGHDLQSLAFDVAKECGGLPIAIVTVAKALKNKEECEWKSALHELQHPSVESLEEFVATKTYSCIKLSYDHLKSEELKSTFLLCSTMIFISNASVEGLLRYAMGLRLFNTINTMEAARDRVNTLIQKLKKSCLLLDTPEGGRFFMHDVVRDVGRSIAMRDRHMFAMKENLVIQDLAEENTLKNCNYIILHDISKLPEELDCPQLEFLYIKPKTRFSKINDNFFKGMLNLGVLHLIEMVLSPLPASFYLLKKLQTLNLDHCHLGDTVDIGNLKNLKILVLSSDIKQLSEEIGELTRLKVLDLSKCSDLQVIPSNTISRLTQLEELYLPYGFDQWQVEGVEGERSNGSLGELEHLSQLTALQIYIPDAKLVPKGLLFQKLQRYTIYIGTTGWRLGYDTSRKLVLSYGDANISVEDGIIKQPKEIEELELIGKQGVKNVLYDLNKNGFPKLKHFVVEFNQELVYIVDFPKQSEPCVAFPHLQTLSLENLINLEKICHGQFTLTPNSFCQLRTLGVWDCVKLKNIFSSSIARHLSQLQRIEVAHCENMEEIFTIVGSENEEIVLEKLESLYLRDLQKLRSFSYEEEVGSTCDEERQMKDSLMPLFDGKVKFPNLKTVKLWEINLKYVFSSSTLGSFVQLQHLKIRNCRVLEEIIRIDDDLKNNVELPSLKTLLIHECPQMKSFIFSDKVTFPSLEEIKISDMDNLEMIWQNQFEDSLNLQCYPKLSKMTVTKCQSLKNLFPASITRNLSQLKDIYVEGCGIKEIVAKEGAEEAGDKTFVFPELTSLSLHNLLELKCFYPGIHTTKWPMLKKLDVIGCYKIDASELFNIQEVILEDQPDIVEKEKVREKVLPNLEELTLDGRKIKMVWQGLFSEILFPKLKFFEIQNDESTVLSPNSLPRSHNLERLSLGNSSYEWIFSCEEVEEFSQIKSLHVNGLGNLKQIWKQDSKVDTNLEKLVVSSCGSLVTLLPPSTSFQNLTVLTVQDCRLINLISSSTAKSLMQLKEIEIKDCNMMTEVVTGDGDGIEDEINFKNLKSLKLISLSRLRKFYSGNYNFNFPSLEILKVESCPKMRIFTSIVANTPMLREIKEDPWKSYYCDGDVNTTMERIHEKKVLSSSNRLQLSANEIRMFLQKFPENKFSKVETLEVFDDESTVFPLDILQRFQNLDCLQLRDSSYKEIFSCEEVEKHTETLAQIKSLRLEKLDDLEQMWIQDSRSDLILHNLESLEVVECNSLITLVPTSASFQNLSFMEISGCNGLRSLVTAAVAKSLVQLLYLWIRNCNEMTEVVANGYVKEDEIIFNKLKTLELTDLSNLTSFYFGNYTLNFPSLNELQVTRCPKMKFFSSGISSTPMLQKIKWGSSKYNLEGDLNTTIQRIHEEMEDFG